MTTLLKRVSLVALALAMAGWSSMAAAVIDQTTGLEAVIVEDVPLPPHLGTIEVLWDLTHGVYLQYEPSGNYANLVALLSGNGYNVSTTNAGIDNIDLSAYDILVINVASTYNSAYTGSEVAAAQAFVDGGGAIFIMGDNPVVWNENIHPISQAYGTTCGIGNENEASSFIAHPIFTGVNFIAFGAGGGLQVGAPSIEAAWSVNGAPVISLVEECQVITIGDVNFCDNNTLGSGDNTTFVLNAFECLANSGGPIATQETTWGQIKSTYK